MSRVENLVALSVNKGRPFLIVGSDKAMGWGYYSHSFVTCLGDDVVLDYNKGGDTAEGKPGKSLTTDGGVTWRIVEGEELLNRPSTMFRGFIPGSNGVYLYNIQYYQQTNQGAWVSTTGDAFIEGPFGIEQKWTTVQHVPVSSWRGVELPNGDLLIPAYATPLKENNPSGKYATYLMRSQDRGRSFEIFSVVADGGDTPWGDEGPCEPALVLLPNGDLYCLMRTGNPNWSAFDSTPMLEARSSDGGVTWKRRKVSFPGVMPKLLVMKNGVLVCAFGRPGNSVIFSLDNGHTWGHEVALTAADVRSSGYCDIAEVASNRLLVAYDAFNTSMSKIWLWEPKEVNGVFGVYVDVRRR